MFRHRNTSLRLIVTGALVAAGACGDHASTSPLAASDSPSAIVAGNDPAAGTGTLTLGPATYELQLIDGGTILDTKSIPITLTSP
jgi:hypothetical protein